MTDTLTGSDLAVLVVPATAAIPSGDVTAPDWTALLGRVAAVEGLGLVDLTDVDPTGLTDGLTLVYDAASATWKPGTLTGTIGAVRDHTATIVKSNADTLVFRLGLTAVDYGESTTWTAVQPIYGTAVNTIAAGNHTHTQPPGVPFDFTASGDLSSGTRTLVSGNVTGLSSDRSYLLTAKLIFDVRGAGTGAGYATARIVLNGTTSSRPENRVNSGVDREVSWEHEGVTVSGVTSVAVSATYQHNGASDPIYVGAGRLVVTRRANR